MCILLVRHVHRGAILYFWIIGGMLYSSRSKRSTAYGVASVSGAILAVCSCTVLPIFKGIYKKGAGLGPAVAFLYSGPAINILAIVLSAKVFGWELGLARAVGAVLFSIIIGVIMALVFREDTPNGPLTRGCSQLAWKHRPEASGRWSSTWAA
jgi:uncharacterized membrane protein YraQ (UPF0718 family)